MGVRFDYIELPADDIGATRSFYEDAFGWQMTDFGGTYMATMTGDTDVALFSDPEQKPAAPLPAFRTDAIEEVLQSVVAAKGRIERPIFAFPGGRRFEAVDPSGNRFAVYQPDPTDAEQD